MWISLHNHSYFSFLRGLASPLELARAAALQQMPAIALTDTLTLTGAVEFYDACLTVGVRPILGLEIPVHLPAENLTRDNLPGFVASDSKLVNGGNLVLLAENLSGWSNLCRLSSLVQTEDRDYVTVNELDQYSDGLLCLSGGRRGLAATLLIDFSEQTTLPIYDQLHMIFNDRFYLELQVWDGNYQPEDYRWCMGLLRIARRMGLPLFTAVDVHYLSPEQADLQRVITAIRLNLPLKEVPQQQTPLPGSRLLIESELLAATKRLPVDDPDRLNQNTLEIADRCRLEIPVGVRHYPEIDLPAGTNPERELRKRAEEGAIHYYGDLSRPVKERLDYELQTIETCGYTSLFLIMDEIIDFAHHVGVPISSRGSAASSLVAHCLGITTPDPIRLNLYFERFLNPMRVTPPDIDTDLCSRRRDQVIHFVYERFGADRVAMVSTINRFRSRSALRETAKAYGLKPAQVSKLLNQLPYRWYGPPDRESSDEPAYTELSRKYPEPIYQTIFRDATALLGIPRHLSIHPGGIVIAPDRITNLVPVTIAPKGIVITQFDLVSIERLGMLKIDLLGIKGLTVIGDVAEAITQERNRTKTEPRPVRTRKNRPLPAVLNVLESIPHDDLPTSQTIQLARTIGCFQIESPGMRATLREIRAKNVDDIMVALALYRPGPLTGGLKDVFVERYKLKSEGGSGVPDGDSQIYLHPALQPLLEETLGVILYQEQVLRIAHELAGFSLSDADLLRRAMSHFDLDKQMRVLKEKFIQGAFQNNNVPEAAAERIWELMAAFAGYGFPKAHAASYAEVAWRAAWCKTHYPAVFMAAVMANWGGYYSQQVYLNESRRMGLVVKPPHINHANHDFSLSYLKEQPILFMGFGQVRDLTQRTISRIIHERPFNSFSDFLVRVDPKQIEAQNLVRSGALEGFGNQPVLLRRLARGNWRAGQLPLFTEEMENLPDLEQDWSLAEKVNAQVEILGVSLIAHPLELAAEAINTSHSLSTIDAALKLGQSVRVAGMRQTWRRSRTQRGDPIYFMSLEDLEGMLDVVIPGDINQKYRSEFSGYGPYIIEGIIDLNPASNEPTIRANRIIRIVAST